MARVLKGSTSFLTRHIVTVTPVINPSFSHSPVSSGNTSFLTLSQHATMVKAIYNGVVIAESTDTALVEGNHYFPPESVKVVLAISDTT